jgi:hypothetical protein
MMQEIIQPSQFYGVPVNKIFEALATVREATAHGEMTRTLLCVLSLDFQEAFDWISHQYLYPILRSYGFSDWFIERIRCMYENASSSVQINGQVAGPIPIHCSFRQGCPVSMMLFALCIDRLLRKLKHNLHVIRIGK